MAELTIDDDACEGGRPFYDDNGNLESWAGSPGFLVVDLVEPKPGAAEEALRAAAERWMRVDDRGYEFRDWDEYDAFDGDPLSPSWVSDPTYGFGGIYLYSDTSGERTVVMTEKLLAILAEELSARDVGGRIAQQPDQSAGSA
ncbi:MAG TPA: hypothetical protein VJL80_11260 [Aeromicrobium sp.]|nr:hypothetical protein [Aeromicrobium sp.]HKY58608.1 hypothetical protein [Aeromicrobium sp.]